MKLRNLSTKELNAVRDKESCTAHGKEFNSFHRKMSSNPKKCFRCDGSYPHSGSCPAQNKSCNKCGKMGHYAKCCKSKMYLPKKEQEGKRFKQKQNPKFRHERQQNQNRPINEVATTHSPNLELSDEYLFAVKSLYEQENVRKQCLEKSEANFETVVQIENNKVLVLIDTGASINIMNSRTFENLNKRLEKPLQLRKTDTKVVTYGSNQPNLKIKGVVDVLIESKSNLGYSKFYVVETNHKNLLSGFTAVQLNILKINKESINKVNEIKKKENNELNLHNFQTTSINNKIKEKFETVPDRLKPILKPYENNVFSGKIGKIKDIQINFHINPDVKPVVQRERRIPFALRDKVNMALEKLQAQGIIEDEPTPWISNLVVVPKGDGVRVCLDMRGANKAIQRTNYPTPTVDDLLIKLKGSTVFTKLDLNSAFHQLELDESSRYMTTFQTDTKLKRYTRLILRNSSMPCARY